MTPADSCPLLLSPPHDSMLQKFKLESKETDILFAKKSSVFILRLLQCVYVCACVADEALDKMRLKLILKKNKLFKFVVLEPDLSGVCRFI